MISVVNLKTCQAACYQLFLIINSYKVWFFLVNGPDVVCLLCGSNCLASEILNDALNGVVSFFVCKITTFFCYQANNMV